MVPLAEVARQAEAAKATQAKAKKSYSNTDLHVSAEPVAARPAAVASKADVTAGGKPTAPEETTNTTTDNEKAAPAPAQTLPEAYWRQRADFIRSQVETAKSEIARLNIAVPGRSAALAASNANEIKKYQQMLDGAMKQWALLDASAQASKVPAAWIGSAP